MRTIILFILLYATSGDAFCQSPVEVNIRNYISAADSGDVTPAVKAALNECRRHISARLLFPAGEYHFKAARAAERYLFISNNDEGLKRIVFDLSAFSGLEIEGRNAAFIFHGYVCPFYIEQAQHIYMHGFSIDWDRPFHSEGKVEAIYKDSMDLSFGKDYPYQVKNERILFIDAAQLKYPFRSLLEFDAVKKETAFMARDYYTGPDIKVRELSAGRVRLYVPRIQATVGNVMVFGAGHRLCPAVTVSDCDDINIRQVKVYHSGGMAFIVQRSSNLLLDSVKVTLPPGKNRIVSATADATHFVNCSGRILIQHCLFENQEDDATNIHGIYSRIVRKTGIAEIELQLMHVQQYGFNYIKPGSRLEFVNAHSLTTYHEAEVQSVERINKEFARVVFAGPLPDSIRAGDAVAMAGIYPEVTIANSVMRNNRARGILLGSRGKTVIENNLFHSPGAAVLFEGDARFWFEQAGVREVLIRNNIFRNCNYGVWGNALIQTGSGIEEEFRNVSRYNRNITIENNRMEIFDPRILNLYSVERLRFRNNTIVTSDAYPNNYRNHKRFEVVASSDILIEE